VTAPLRDYTNIEEKNCQLVTHYRGKKFSHPRSVAIGPNDEVIIANRGNKEVVVFDKNLKMIRTFGQSGGDSELNTPVGVAVGHNVIAVSEFDDHVVKKSSLQGDYLSEFGSYGSENGQFKNPQGLCFNSKGLLYVMDHGNYRVQVFTENMFLFKFGSKGHNPGQFQYPRYIAVDSSDQVYVTDNSHGGGIHVFSEDGHFIKKINCKKPFAICIAPDDYIITNDNHNNCLTIFSPTHQLMSTFGLHGKEKGQFYYIHDIAINNSGTIFVTEGGNNNRLQIISY